jgi:hypothetical protein
MIKKFDTRAASILEKISTLDPCILKTLNFDNSKEIADFLKKIIF